jgi:predicted nucleic acid-binding protein
VTAFFDTNVLVYSFLDIEKRQRALETLSAGGIISVQVLNEFTNVARNKRGRSWQDIEAALSVIRLRFPEIVPITHETHATACTLARDHTLSFYDALIVASALEAGCDTLSSEDLQDGRSFSGLKIVNPFAPNKQ